MTTTQSSAQSVQFRSAIAWTAGISAVWILVAVLRPQTTLHLGAVIVPLIPAFLLKGHDRALQGVIAGIALGAATIAALSLTGNLDGPPIEPFQSTLTESFVVLGVSGILGLIFARVTQKR